MTDRNVERSNSRCPILVGPRPQTDHERPESRPLQTAEEEVQLLLGAADLELTGDVDYFVLRAFQGESLGERTDSSIQWKVHRSTVEHSCDAEMAHAPR
jgi:hypothetical protein